jgi:hypothetical protein
LKVPGKRRLEPTGFSAQHGFIGLETQFSGISIMDRNVGGLGRSCCVFRNPVVHLGDWQSVVGWQVDSGCLEEEEAYVCQAFCCAVKWQDPTISLDRSGLAFTPTLTLGKRSAMPFTL